MKSFRKIRVLDLSRVLAAPWAAQLLGDFGADVIKVERPKIGDDSRSFPPFLKDAEGKPTKETSFFLSANRNKRSITLDISKPEGQEIIRKLAKDCDVLLENYKVGDLARYGLDYPSLTKINPRLIYCSVTGFGQTGPYRQMAGYDTIFQALGGLMSVTGLPNGEPGGGPMKTGPSLADIIGGQFASAAILGALYERDIASGMGQHIDISLTDCVVAAVSHYANHYLVSGEVPPRRGSDGNGGLPSGMFRCKDDDVVIVVGNDRQFSAFCVALKSSALANDARFTTNNLRVRFRNQLKIAVGEVISGYSADEFLDLMRVAGVPASRVNNLEQVFTDPQIIERDMVQTFSHCSARDCPVSIVANPIKYSEQSLDFKPPPALGEHTDEILASLGYSSDKIQELRHSGVL